MSTAEIHILLVEDNEGDIVLTLEALNDAKLRNQISVVRDGEQALEFLSKRGTFVNATTPQLVLLDINLPRIDGKEVLQRIKTDPDLKKIPVVILTTSSSERDIVEAYSNHANCYITKPVDLDKFISVIHCIEDFWISIVQLPKP
jgi:two-component system, chemotaxis family, response regulator Rcp1